MHAVAGENTHPESGVPGTSVRHIFASASSSATTFPNICLHTPGRTPSACNCAGAPCLSVRVPKISILLQAMESIISISCFCMPGLRQHVRPLHLFMSCRHEREREREREQEREGNHSFVGGGCNVSAEKSTLKKVQQCVPCEGPPDRGVKRF